MTLTLPPELTIAQAASFHAELVKAAARRPKEVVLDCSPLLRIDATGLQLLVAFARALEARRRTLTLTGLAPDGPLARAARLAGLPGADDADPGAFLRASIGH